MFLGSFRVCLEDHKLFVSNPFDEWLDILKNMIGKLHKSRLYIFINSDSKTIKHGHMRNQISRLSFSELEPQFYYFVVVISSL